MLRSASRRTGACSRSSDTINTFKRASEIQRVLRGNSKGRRVYFSNIEKRNIEMKLAFHHEMEKIIQK